MAEEATINPDGTQDMPPTMDDEIPLLDEETMEEVVKGIDPAIYLLIAAVVVLVGMIYFSMTKKKGDDDFFDELDGDKVCKPHGGGAGAGAYRITELRGYHSTVLYCTNLNLLSTPCQSYNATSWLLHTN